MTLLFNFNNGYTVIATSWAASIGVFQSSSVSQSISNRFTLNQDNPYSSNSNTFIPGNERKKNICYKNYQNKRFGFGGHALYLSIILWWKIFEPHWCGRRGSCMLGPPHIFSFLFLFLPSFSINQIHNGCYLLFLNPNLGGKCYFYPLSPCWFSLNNSEIIKAVSLEFCTIQ